MNTRKPAVAAVQGLLILPALLFMGALVVRNLHLTQHGLGQNAQSIVMWYSARQWTLWMLLIALPLAVLLVGCLTWLFAGDGAAAIHRRPTTLFIATATLMAGVTLAIVVMHMLAN